jgi:hypothetical protein
VLRAISRAGAATVAAINRHGVTLVLAWLPRTTGSFAVGQT